MVFVRRPDAPGPRDFTVTHVCNYRTQVYVVQVRPMPLLCAVRGRGTPFLAIREDPVWTFSRDTGLSPLISSSSGTRGSHRLHSIVQGVVQISDVARYGVGRIANFDFTNDMSCASRLISVTERHITVGADPTLEIRNRPLYP